MKKALIYLFPILLLSGCGTTKYVPANNKDTVKLDVPKDALTKCSPLELLPQGNISREQFLEIVKGWANTHDECSNKQEVLSNAIQRFNNQEINNANNEGRKPTTNTKTTN